MPPAFDEALATAGLDTGTLVVVLLAFLIAGTVKGLAGLGLPMVALGLTVLVVDFKTAIALLVVPALVGNVWQALMGGAFWAIVRRHRLFLGIGFVVTFVTQLLSQGWDERALTTVLGLIVMLYTGIMLLTRPVYVPAGMERWLSPIVAFVSGILSGLSGAFAVPAAIYFQSLGLNMNLIVQTLGIWFLVAAVALAAGVTQSDAASGTVWLLSCLCTLPVLGGMRVGQVLRSRLSEARFRKVFLAALCLIGAWLAFRGLFLVG